MALVSSWASNEELAAFRRALPDGFRVHVKRDHQPDLIAVTFDRPEPTFRHEMVPTYKAVIPPTRPSE